MSLSIAAIMAVSACYALTACGEQGEETDGTQVTQEEWTKAFEVFCDDVNESLWNKKANFKENLKITLSYYPSEENTEHQCKMEMDSVFDGDNYKFVSKRIRGNEVTEIQGWTMMNQNGTKSYYVKPSPIEGWQIYDDTEEDEEENGVDVIIETSQLISSQFSIVAPFYERASYNEEEKSYEVVLSYQEMLEEMRYEEDLTPHEDESNKDSRFTIKFEKKKVVLCVAEYDPSFNTEYYPIMETNVRYDVEYGGQKVEAPIS